MAELPEALYVPDGDDYVATALTRGPWDPGAQHAGPPSALLARALERASGLAGARTARASFDILRPIPIGRLRASARVIRPGRRVELVEGALTDTGGAELLHARAWRIRRAVDAPATAPDPPPAAPESCPPAVHWAFWEEVAYHRAFDWRFAAGAFTEPGPAAAWARLLVPLVAGEAPSPFERLLCMADAASGISAQLDWNRHIFINVDLGIHLERAPAGEWTSMDARTRIGPEGAGLCTSVLGDADGRVGVSTQSLLVAPRA